MIDTSIFFFYLETMHYLLFFSRFQSIFSMTVWNTIDDRYPNVVLFIEMMPHFEAFPLRKSVIISMIDAPIYWYYLGRVNGLVVCQESHF